MRRKRTHVVSMEAPPHGGDQVELSVAPVIAQHVRQVIGVEPERAEAREESATSSGGPRGAAALRRHPHPATHRVLQQTARDGASTTERALTGSRLLLLPAPLVYAMQSRHVYKSAPCCAPELEGSGFRLPWEKPSGGNRLFFCLVLMELNK